MNIRTLKRLTPLVMLALLTLAVLLPVVPTGAMVITNSPLDPSLPFDKLTNRRDEDFAAIDRYVEDEMRAQRIPGLALGIVQGDQIVHLKGFGVADPGGRVVTPQTPFIIGSTTKSFTALAIMQLVEAGKIELDAPIQRYLPTFHLADETAATHITVRHLLHQTTGLSTRTGRDQPSTTSDDALERRVRSFATAQLTEPVGTHYQYSGANYAILGLIVQAVAGQSYETYVQEQIFAPLDMRQSFTSQTAAQQHGMAIGYRYWFGVPVAANLPYNRASLPQGYLISSAEDIIPNSDKEL
jgi:CubicO group peptidase (beta-lactamase class C family)